MKNLVVLFTLFLCVGLQVTVDSQTTVQIKGIVMSSGGAMQGVRVEFKDAKGEYLTSCTTQPDGKFISDKKIAIGQTIKIVINYARFKPVEKEYKVGRSGDAGEIMLEKNMVISGYIIDSITELPLKDVEMSYYEQSKAVQFKSTNSQGYFDLEKDFDPGEKITIRASKDGYYPKERTLTINTDENRFPDIQLPGLDTRALRATIRINDKKSGKPLNGVTVQYRDPRKNVLLDTLLSPKGEVELKLYQRPGSILDLKISRPNYVTITAQQTLSEEARLNMFTYEMERDRRSALGPALLIGGGASALVSGGMYLSSQSIYKDYKNYSNYTNAKDREDDLTKAQQKQNIAVVAAGVAAGAIIIYIIYKVSEKNKEKAAIQKKTRIGFIQPASLSTAYATGNTSIVDIVYRF